MGAVFIITGTVMFAASVFTRSEWLIAVTNVAIGAQVERAGPPAGVINITVGVLLLLWNWRQRRNPGRPAAAGAKSRALRDALIRHMRDRSVPVPA